MLRPFTEEEALEYLLEGVEDPTLAKTVASLLAQSPDDLVATGNAKDALQVLLKALTIIVDRTIDKSYEDVAASDLGEEWQ